MTQRFEFHDFKCELRAGGPPVGSCEQQAPLFIEELNATGKVPRGLRRRDMVSWILARLAHLTYGGLQFEGNSFISDGGDFSYQIKVSDAAGTLMGRWAVVFWANRIQFSGFGTGNFNGQSLFVKMLVDEPDKFEKCEIEIRNPDAKTKESFGWNGYQFL